MRPLLSLLLAVGLASSPSSASPALAAQGFVERAAEVGLVHRPQAGLDRVGNLPNFYDWVQVGVGLGDLDGDGDLDVVALGRIAPNALFRNDGGAFVDVAAGAGLLSAELDTAVALGDVDRDGDLDLAIGVLDGGEGAEPGDGRLLRNDGGGGFENVTELVGRVGSGHTIAVKLHDLDLDGRLDLATSEFHGTPNRVYRGLPGGAFVDVSEEAGAAVGGSTHVTGVCDVDDDGYPDLSIGNDWPVSLSAGLTSTLGEVQLNGRADGTYEDVTIGSGLDFKGETMGLAVGDVNYDGRPDSYRTQVGAQFLCVNHGWPGSGVPYTLEQKAYGVDAPLVPDPEDPGTLVETVGWGTAFLDVDLDPWLDLLLVTGHVCPLGGRGQRDFLFLGQGPGAGFAFADEARELGLEDLADERALAVGDLDADGDLDLLIAGAGLPLRYEENRVEREGGWLAVRPVPRTSAPGGAGTRVEWTDDLGLPHVRWVGADGETASQHELRAHFGLGDEPAVDLRVRFPSGVELAVPGVPADTALEVEEPELARLSAEVLAAPAGGGAPAPAPPPGPPSGLAASPTSTGAPVRGGELVVTALAHDAAGTPLGPDAAVEIDVPGLVPAGPVVHAGDNAFERRFRGGAVGGHRVRVAFDGFEPLVRPRVHVLGAPSATATTARVAPESVRAGTADAFEVRVVPRDAAGLPLGPGRRVAVEIPGLAGRTPLADRGDGRYAATFAAPAEPATLSVVLVVDGEPLGEVATVPAAGPVDAAASTVEAQPPVPTVALDLDRMPLLVTPRDAAGRPLGPGALVELELVPDVHAAPAWLLDLGPAAQDDGDHVLVLQKPAEAPYASASGTYTVRVDGTVVATGGYAF